MSYVGIQIGMALISAVMSVIVMNIHRKQSPVPSWLRSLSCSALMRLLCMNPAKGRAIADVAENTTENTVAEKDFITEETDKKTRDSFCTNQSNPDWEYITKMTDRIFLYLYIILNVIGVSHIIRNFKSEPHVSFL